MGTYRANAFAAVGRQPTQVLVVDDDAMVREWVRLVLQGSEFELAGVASTAAEGLDLERRRGADLVLLDYRLPDRLGTDLARELRRRGVDVPILLMTANAEPGLNELAHESGAQGSVLKTGDPEELVAALRAALGGAQVFDPRHPRRPAGRPSLTPRERQVLGLVARGATNAEIAGELGVGSETVKTLLSRAFAKLGVRRRAEAVAVARDRRII